MIRPYPVLVLLSALLLLSANVNAQSGATVQSVLESWYRARPDLMERLPNGRLHLKRARAESTPPELEAALQEAFYQEHMPMCVEYGRRYLIDWHLLLAKAARETYWGSSKLSNLARNYYGIRLGAKEWICRSFGYCQVSDHFDPEPTYFFMFDGFESSLWMFIHTIYSRHFLERLPDGGTRVALAIEYERRTGRHYWMDGPDAPAFTWQLAGAPYANEEVITTWSGYSMNNLCVECDPHSDLDWINKVHRVEVRMLSVEAVGSR